MPFDSVGVAGEEHTIWGRGEVPPCDVIKLASPQRQLLLAE